ncbi:MAG: SUMF1/EgtB/PvdO family nonheme iron enzyme [Anaerolineae bacterium]
MEFSICEVQAGVYPIGDNSMSVSRAAHTVELGAFAMGETSVTNLQFLGFIEAGGYSNSAYWSEMGWHWQEGKSLSRPAFVDDANFNAPDQPVVGVSWYEADAFARWLATVTSLNWRLPTEAEWEAAARGPEGDAPRPRNYNTAERRLGHTWAVTEAGNRSWCGALDMCGNVWEWCSTRWGRNWQTQDYRYPYHAGDGREDITGSHARIIRGGSWFDGIQESNPANRARFLPGSRASNIGFRLARSL